MADFFICPPSSVVLRHLSLAGLVVFAGSLNPIPARTRPLNSPAPMVLSLKAWKSRSLPGLPRTEHTLHGTNSSTICSTKTPPRKSVAAFLLGRIFVRDGNDLAFGL